jgi:hypothetical protein
MKACIKLMFLFFLLIGSIVASPALAIHLQDAYNQAEPGEGYDKRLILEPGETYTGYLVVDPRTSCVIHGNGALIVLDPTGFISAPSGAKLDIDGCVITGGSIGLNYDWGSNSTVQNCTLVENGMGIRCWGTMVVIKNCVIANNYQHGIACLETFEPVVLYNDVWGNVQLDYAAYCPG